MDPGINPGAVEVCDSVDNNCDSVIDKDAADRTMYYVDSDGDGYGDAALSVLSCDPVPGSVSDGTDCDDSDASVYPYAPEACDGGDVNCDGFSGSGDADGDGIAACNDCDDGDASAYPGNTETCDGIDNDCDVSIDNDAADALTWYADMDGDSYGDASSTDVACSASAGYVADSTDCNDGRSDVNPGETELCDGSAVDEDCNGLVNDADPGMDPSGLFYLYEDTDSDGYGDAATEAQYCESPDPSWIGDSSDCDDADADVNPGAIESCDGIDNNCDGSVDEAGAVGESTWYADSDSDGYGDVSTFESACEVPIGYVANATDCDDGDASAYPGAAEIVADGIDQDCDGSDLTNPDTDGDGYDDVLYGGTDCDDAESSVNPGAIESCDGIDDDCDGDVDESGSAGESTWYADVDSDGYGDAMSSEDACEVPIGYVANATDCDDSESSVNPGAIESCDGIDDDCDGDVDESGSAGESTWYADVDSDGYGDAMSSEDACSASAGYVANGDDCDDGDASAYPGAAEIVADGIDQDCDGADSTLPDSDGDGDPDVTDCNDADATVYTGATEVEGDGIDNDCDGVELVYDEDFGTGTGSCTVGSFVRSDGGSVHQMGSCVILIQEGGSLSAPSLSDDITLTGLTAGQTYTFRWYVENQFSSSVTIVADVNRGTPETATVSFGGSDVLEVTWTATSTSTTARIWTNGTSYYDGMLDGFTVTR